MGDKFVHSQFAVCSNSIDYKAMSLIITKTSTSTRKAAIRGYLGYTKREGDELMKSKH